MCLYLFKPTKQPGKGARIYKFIDLVLNYLSKQEKRNTMKGKELKKEYLYIPTKRNWSFKSCVGYQLPSFSEAQIMWWINSASSKPMVLYSYPHQVNKDYSQLMQVNLTSKHNKLVIKKQSDNSISMNPANNAPHNNRGATTP